jgi:formylglycine-generating enzyme required for sulfatase activity
MPAERSPRALCGRADLLRMRAAGLTEEAAEFIGYDYVPPQPPEPPPPQIVIDDLRPPWRSPEKTDTGEGHSKVLFRRVTGYEALSETPAESSPPPPPEGNYIPVAAGKLKPLDSFSRVAPGLRRNVALPRETRELDSIAVVRRLGRGEVITDAPRKRRRRWGGQLSVLSERADRLIPYRRDYERLLADLELLFPKGSVREIVLEGPTRAPVPATGGVVLAFTDLGTLWTGGAAAQDAWASYGRRLQRAGCQPVALLPATPLRNLNELASIWRIVGWRPLRAPLPEDERKGALDRLITLAAPALRVEPGLLRELRLLLDVPADPGVEAEFWQSPALSSNHVDAATLHAEARRRGLAGFAGLPRELRRRALEEALLGWRPKESRFVFGVEVKSLDEDSQQLLSDGIHAKIAQDLTELAEKARRSENAGATGWLRVTTGALTDEAWRAVAREPATQRALFEMWSLSHRGESTAPLGYDPSLLPKASRPARRLALHERGARLVATEDVAPIWAGSRLGTIISRGDELSVGPVGEFWQSGQPPIFAENWGRDAIGAWFEFSVSGSQGLVTQRLRWIKPGKFLMGAPETEAERSDDEGPQHEVRVEKGFWLFDTACTQALWTAVMGENPSRFKGANRPVEKVSWNDAQDFIDRINERVPGLALSLPSEAQWEYACRAGTTTPFSFGENITPAQVNYDGTHPYANGKRGLYRRETVAVGSLPANTWGFYEMHGNVWEWCADAWHKNYEGAPADGSVWQSDDPAATRVVRGGSWSNGARPVRSACRSRNAPDARYVFVGFRCSRVQDEAEPAETRRIQAERGIAASPTGGAERERRIFLGAEGAGNFFPRGGSFVIRSDCERLTVESLAKPDWAAAIGRDRFGLWTRIEVDGRDGPVSQRLRWINPGYFLMGSPETEAGRFDGESPQHEVRIEKGFWLFDTACTQAMWMAVMGENPSRFYSLDRPVENVSWNSTQEFIARINGEIPGLALTLPSEAQWEYACRAGTTTPFSFGEDITSYQVNYDGNHPYAGGAKGPFREETLAVGSLPPNGWGLHEMHGNVWEWCADPWHKDYLGAPADGAVWECIEISETTRRPGFLATALRKVRRSVKRAEANTDAQNAAPERVARGGSWINYARHVRSASRYGNAPNIRYDNFGFRCCRAST